MDKNTFTDRHIIKIGNKENHNITVGIAVSQLKGLLAVFVALACHCQLNIFNSDNLSSTSDDEGIITEINV